MKKIVLTTATVIWIMIFGLIIAKPIICAPVDVFSDEFTDPYLSDIGKSRFSNKSETQENYYLTAPRSDFFQSTPKNAGQITVPTKEKSEASLTANTQVDQPESIASHQNKNNDPDEINVFLLKWISAWQNTAGENGDMEQYVSFYSDFFYATALDRKDWIIDKKKKNNNKTWIQVDLESIEIGKPDAKGAVEIRFLQNYKSSNYSDQSRKQLILIKERGKWKILTERTLAAQEKTFTAQ